MPRRKLLVCRNGICSPFSVGADALKRIDISKY